MVDLGAGPTMGEPLHVSLSCCVETLGLCFCDYWTEVLGVKLCLEDAKNKEELSIVQQEHFGSSLSTHRNYFLALWRAMGFLVSCSISKGNF